MPDRIEVDVVYVPREILVIADDMLPIPALQTACSLFACRLWLRPGGPCARTNGFVNASLIKRHRIGKLASPSGSVQTVWMWSGNMTNASTSKGCVDLMRLTLDSKSATASAELRIGCLPWVTRVKK